MEDCAGVQAHSAWSRPSLNLVAGQGGAGRSGGGAGPGGAESAGRGWSGSRKVPGKVFFVYEHRNWCLFIECLVAFIILGNPVACRK
jgi:hypothetical protein